MSTKPEPNMANLDVVCNIARVVASLSTKRWCLLPHVLEVQQVPRSIDVVLKNKLKSYLPSTNTMTPLDALRLICLSSLPGVVVVETTVKKLFDALSTNRIDLFDFNAKLSELSWGVLQFKDHVFTKVTPTKLFQYNGDDLDKTVIVVAKFAPTRMWGIRARVKQKFQLCNDEVDAGDVSYVDFRSTPRIVCHMNKDLLSTVKYDEDSNIVSTAEIVCGTAGRTISYVVRDAAHARVWNLIQKKDIDDMVGVITSVPTPQERTDKRQQEEQQPPPQQPPPQQQVTELQLFDQLLRWYSVAQTDSDTDSESFTLWTKLNSVNNANDEAKLKRVRDVQKELCQRYYDQTFSRDRTYIQSWVAYLSKLSTHDSGRKAATTYKDTIGDFWETCATQFKNVKEKNNAVSLEAFPNELSKKFREHWVYKYLEEAKWFSVIKTLEVLHSHQGIEHVLYETFCTYTNIINIGKDARLFKTFKTLVSSWLEKLRDNTKDTFVTTLDQAYSQECLNYVNDALLQVQRTSTQTAEVWRKLVETFDKETTKRRDELWTRTHGFYHPSLSIGGKRTVLPFLYWVFPHIHLIPDVMFRRRRYAQNQNRSEVSWKLDDRVNTWIGKLEANNVTSLPDNLPRISLPTVPTSLEGVVHLIRTYSRRVDDDEPKYDEHSVASICANVCQSAYIDTSTHAVNVYAFLQYKDNSFCLVAPPQHDDSKVTIKLKLAQSIQPNQYTITETLVYKASGDQQTRAHIPPRNAHAPSPLSTSSYAAQHSSGSNVRSKDRHTDRDDRRTHRDAHRDDHRDDHRDTQLESETTVHDGVQHTLANLQALEATPRCGLMQTISRCILLGVLVGVASVWFWSPFDCTDTISSICLQVVDAATTNMTDTELANACVQAKNAQTNSKKLQELMHVVLQANHVNLTNVHEDLTWEYLNWVKVICLCIVCVAVQCFKDPKDKGVPMWLATSILLINSILTGVAGSVVKPLELGFVVGAMDFVYRLRQDDTWEKEQQAKKVWHAETCTKQKTSNNITYTCEFTHPVT